MKIINAAIVALFLLMGVSVFVSVYNYKYAPRVEMNNGKGFHRIYAQKLDTQTFIVRCNAGDFFRIAANNKTVITSFAPSPNGWAIIHFEFVK